MIESHQRYQVPHASLYKIYFVTSIYKRSNSLIYRKKLNSVFLKNILSLKPRIVIHFEPIFEYNLKNKKTKNTKKLNFKFRKIDKNDSLNIENTLPCSTLIKDSDICLDNFVD